MRVLIVEDEQAVVKSIKKGLKQEGYEAETAETGEEGFFLVNEQVFDLIILDIMLPGRTGLEILHVLRKRDRKTPVILLTARGTVADKVNGLDAGADDYLTKPFAFPELVARIKALHRRSRSNEVKEVQSLRCGDLVMDLLSQTVRCGVVDVELTGREFKLLEYLMRYRGRTVSREMLARDVWQEANRTTPLDNVIDVYIARIRKKTDHLLDRRLIHTV
ncbi:MAG: response regulator transcription factor, partial [Syntrophobacteraceae bacterium]